MKKSILVVLLVVLTASFMVGTMASETEAKVDNCWDTCIDGMEAKCCEITRGYYVLVRCRILNPPTPC